MNTVHPVQVTKNQAFTFYVRLFTTEFSSPTSDSVLTSFLTFDLYKDGVDSGALTNTPIIVSANEGIIKVNLTADEMNADVVMVAIDQNSSNAATFRHIYMIYTTTSSGSGGGASAEDVWTYEDRELTSTNNINLSPGGLGIIGEAYSKNYSVKKVAYAESGYNYFGLTNPNGLWIIIRDKVDFSETKLFLARQKQLDFSTQWDNRASLNYQFSEPF